MIECRLINNAQYDLKEREAISASFSQDPSVPHVLLSTCNRIELYQGEGDVPETIVRHLYRVASGLESSLIGERAIQGQIKLAYKEATEKYKLPSSLNRLFQSAIHTGKRVRTETGISEGAVSHSQATVEILTQEIKELKNKVVSIIGVNKLTEDILKYLSAKGAMNIFLSNRNSERASGMAGKYNGTAIRLDNKRSMLEFTDVLICATSAPHLIIRKEDMPVNKEMLVIDLAFPRDVDETIGSMEKVTLFNLEDIEQHAKKNISLRYHEIEKAQQIIEEEINKFMQWQMYSKLSNRSHFREQKVI
ncbi:MAG: glutamyl-tRNA reductase [Candidatus Azobacteroides sp.]|nr:glutamyl-tRNA reductase [Candidatus Azobacteroides sp.]